MWPTDTLMLLFLAGASGLGAIAMLRAALFTVDRQTTVVVQRLGKFLRKAGPGLHVQIPFIDKVVGRMSLRVQQLDVPIETKTEDNVSVQLVVAVHYYVLPEKVCDAFCQLEETPRQISSFVLDFVRAHVSKIKLEVLFERKHEIAEIVKGALAPVLNGLGYGIVKASVIKAHRRRGHVRYLAVPRAARRTLWLDGRRRAPALPRGDARSLRGPRALASGDLSKLEATLRARGEMAPQQLGPYRLLRLIARGGMAEVFLATRRAAIDFEKTLVVKRILPQLADDASFVKMFVEEAKLCAQLSHPNIVPVFELGQEDGALFLAMEYVAGRDLNAIQRALWATGAAFDPYVLTWVAREVTRALHYAHELRAQDGRHLGINHRDVSPSNLIIGFDGTVKLLDFGIAITAGDPRAQPQPGTLMGKFAYMAPEQIEGRPMDRRADLFALGTVLWEGLAGRRLFKGANDAETLLRVCEFQVTAPSRVRPEVPADLDAVVLRALERDPARRWQSAAAMGAALDDVLLGRRVGMDDTRAMLWRLFPEGPLPVPQTAAPTVPWGAPFRIGMSGVHHPD